MARSIHLLLITILAAASVTASAQAVQTAGMQVIVPARGELVLPNDEARVTLTIEEQHKDRSAAASLVNRKMKQGIDIVKKQDSRAQLKTYGYYTYAVYAQEASHANSQSRQIVGWRVGQSLDVVTVNLDNLPTMVAAAQSVLALNGLQFGLSPAAQKTMDAGLIAATYKNLTERIGFTARAIGRSAADATLEALDFDGSGNISTLAPTSRSMMLRDAAPMSAPKGIAEPSFEPGESTVSMQLIGKVRFK